jgi:glycosyltransferase involved in cell wall biosynthesis
VQFIKNQMKVDTKKVNCLPDGILPDFFKESHTTQTRKELGIPKTRKVVLYTGSLMMSKGIDYLLDSIPQILEQNDSVYFLIVGYPVTYCKKRVRDLRVEDFVYFAGRVDYFQLPGYLALGDIAVDPKVDRGGEGSGKLVNYMAAGLPVVCFDTHNNRTTLNENGFFAEPGNTVDFANKIKEALTNDTKAKAFGNENRRRVHDVFSWKKNGETLSEIYLKLMKRER